MTNKLFKCNICEHKYLPSAHNAHCPVCGSTPIKILKQFRNSQSGIAVASGLIRANPAERYARQLLSGKPLSPKGLIK